MGSFSVPAVVTAGDRRASKAVAGQSKVFLEIEGRPLVAFVVAALQRVPEVSEVWVVGDAERLETALAPLRGELRKPLHVVPQLRNLFENGWQTYRRLLPGAPPEGRDPGPADARIPVLYLSADLPFATPQEISEFVRRSLELGCDYALGLVTEESLRAFYPTAPGAPGIRMAYFNLREGRMRQSNLHLVKPARIGNRHYIEEMYEHRYQRQLGQILALGWRILTIEGGGFGTLWAYGLMHLAGLLDRWGLRRLADRLRWRIPASRVERHVSRLLQTDWRLIVTEAGGCAVDVDNDHDFDVAVERFDDWTRAQQRKATELYGPLPLPERAGEAPTLRVVPGGDA
jgi:hypothetical protein